MTSVRWILYGIIKEMYPDVEVKMTYGAVTKEQRRELNLVKSHVNDAYAMGGFHPLHRAHPVVYQKKHRNNRVLEKFYDAKYIDLRDGKKHSGQDLASGRTNRNHNLDTENLHKYRGEKVSKGRRSIRRNRYPYQPHDLVVYNGQTFETGGCQNKGAYLLIAKKPVSVSKVQLRRYCGGYFGVAI